MGRTARDSLHKTMLQPITVMASSDVQHVHQPTDRTEAAKPGEGWASVQGDYCHSCGMVGHNRGAMSHPCHIERALETVHLCASLDWEAGHS